MKKLSFLLCLIAFVSCSGLGTRNPASHTGIEIYEVGDIKTSILSPNEFRDRFGKVWVLMDGQNVSGSEYELVTSMTNVPDARGKFLRMNNNGAKCSDNNCNYDLDSNRALGSFQKDSFKKHGHKITAHHSTKHAHTDGGGNFDGLWAQHRRSSRHRSTHDSGGGETRPKNISVNFYIKIDSCSNSETTCR